MSMLFEITHGPRTRSVTLDQPSVTLGSAHRCDLVLNFPWLKPHTLIVQEDPPAGMRVKVLDPEALASLNGTKLGANWTRLESGSSITVAGPIKPIVIRVKSGHSHAVKATVLQANSPASQLPRSGGADDDFGVMFVTESAVPEAGQGRAWVGDRTPAIPAMPPADVSPPGERQPKRPATRLLAVTSAVMIALIVATIAFVSIRASRARAALQADAADVDASIDRARKLINDKKYVEAKIELDHGRIVAKRWPTALADQAAEIDRIADRPTIRLGTNGYVEVFSRWLPAAVASAWTEARRRDDPTIEELYKKARDADGAGKFDDARLACEEAIALIDKEPVKDHPRRPSFESMLAHAKDESFKQQMLAKGLVQYQGQWLEPAEKFRREQAAKGLVEYKGKWVPKAQAFAAEQTDKGLILFEGKWMTPDQAMIAQGYVQLDGKWVTVSERDAAQALRTRLGSGASSRRPPSQAGTAPAAPPVAGSDEAKRLAYTVSQRFVKGQLKSPDTARFDTYESSRVAVVYTSGWYLVSATVQARGSNGTTARRTYLCKLRPVAGSDQWEEDSTTIIE